MKMKAGTCNRPGGSPYLSIQSSEEKTVPEMSSQRLLELSTISHGCTVTHHQRHKNMR